MAQADDNATRQQILQFMTTEHFVLQTARSATIQEVNWRASLFLTSVFNAERCIENKTAQSGGVCERGPETC